MSAKQESKSASPVLGEYVVDLKELGDVPLSKIVGNVGTPFLLAKLQEKLWTFLQRQNVLIPGNSNPRKRRVQQSALKKSPRVAKK